MADQITFNEFTMKDEACYANKSAWHGKGSVITDNDLSSSRFLTESGLGGWKMELQPLQTSTGIVVPDMFATVRTDINKVLGTVGARYHMFQNEQVFEFLDSLKDNMEYESAFSMFDSTKVCVVARMPSVDHIAEGDDTLRYIMFLTSHDGTQASLCVPTSVRVVCNNTVQLTLSKHKGLIRAIKHTQKQESRLATVKQYLLQYDAEFQAFADQSRLLAERKYNQDLFAAYMNELFPSPADDASTRAKNIYTEAKANLVQSFNHPTNNLPSIKGTMWQAFNVVTYAVDHLSNGHRTEENNLDSLLFGKKSEFKQKAFELALQMSS